MPERSPKKKSDEQAPLDPAPRLSAHEEFALRAAKPLPIPLSKETIDEAIAAGVRQELDPDNPENRPLLAADNLGKLAQAFDVLAAGEKIGEDYRITSVEYDTAAMRLKAVSGPGADLLPPIPLLESVSGQPTLEGVDREASYDNVRLAFALTSHALDELDRERRHLSEKALAAVQASLQRIRELTVHFPLASMAEGLSKYQIAGLLNAVNMTITSDPVKAVIWKDRDTLQKALDRIGHP